MKRELEQGPKPKTPYPESEMNWVKGASMQQRTARSGTKIKKPQETNRPENQTRTNWASSPNAETVHEMQSGNGDGVQKRKKQRKEMKSGANVRTVNRRNGNQCTNVNVQQWRCGACGEKESTLKLQ